MKVANQVKNKLYEYGLLIHDEKENENGVTFITDQLVIFVDEKEKVISLSFHISARCDIVALKTLVIREVPNVDVLVLEPFIFDNKQIKIGEEAYNKWCEQLTTNVKEELSKKMIYEDILLRSECFSC